VAQNLFADTSLVLDTAATSNSNDGNNVHLFGSLPSGILGQTTTKYGGPTVNGYSSIYDSDVVYNTGVSWTTDLQTAVNNNHASPRIFDLQTASLHELGHTIGMGDLYSIDSSGNVKTTDLEQVMDAYDAPQRTLGNGDISGVQKLYGAGTGNARTYNVRTDSPGVFRPSERCWYLDYNNDGYVDFTTYYGLNGDLPIVGDWLGNGKDTIGVFRPSERSWYLDYNNDGYVDFTTYYGLNGDLPVTGKW